MAGLPGYVGYNMPKSMARVRVAGQALAVPVEGTRHAGTNLSKVFHYLDEFMAVPKASRMQWLTQNLAQYSLCSVFQSFMRTFGSLANTTASRQINGMKKLDTFFRKHSQWSLFDCLHILGPFLHFGSQYKFS